MSQFVWYRGIAANLLCMACHMSVTLLPLYLKRQGFQDYEIGWLAAGFSLAAVGSRSGLGELLERWGRKPFLYLGALFLTVPNGLYAELGSGFEPWVAVRLLQGVGLGLYITTILTWVADSSPPDKIAQRQGVFGISGLLGAALGPILAEAVYLAYGFETMFRLFGLLGLIAVALSSSLPETKRRGLYDYTVKPQRLDLHRHRATLWVTVPFGWFVGTVITFIAPYCDEIGLEQVGVYFAGFALASVAVRILSGSFIDQVSVNRLVVVNGALMALSGFCMAYLKAVPSETLLFAAALVNGVGHGFLFPGLSAHTVRLTSSEQRGAGMALFTGVFDGGLFLGALASGYIAQWFGYASTFFVASVLLLLSLPCFVRFNEIQAVLEPEELRPIPTLQDGLSSQTDIGRTAPAASTIGSKNA